MRVVSDSSPLHYLILIDAIDILPALFGQVIIPPEVSSELTHPSAPASVREMLSAPSSWLRTETPTQAAEIERLRLLGPGESAAIRLAIGDPSTALLLIDDADGRRVAAQMGIRPLGTLGVLAMASEAALLDLPMALQRLRATSFYVSPKILEYLLDKHETSKRPSNS